MINVNTNALMSSYVVKGACARQAKVTTVLNKDIIDNVAQDVRTEAFVGESLAIQEAILNSKNPLVRGFLNKELEDLLYKLDPVQDQNILEILNISRIDMTV